VGSTYTSGGIGHSHTRDHERTYPPLPRRAWFVTAAPFLAPARVQAGGRGVASMGPLMVNAYAGGVPGLEGRRPYLHCRHRVEGPGGVSLRSPLLTLEPSCYGPTSLTKMLAGSDPWVIVKNGNTADPFEPSPT
jgi:hypothetical protein